MKAGYKRASSKLLAAVLALLMVFGNVASPVSGAFSVYATDENAVVNAEEETLSEEAADEASAEEQLSEEAQQDQDTSDQGAAGESEDADSNTSADAGADVEAAENNAAEDAAAEDAPKLMKNALTNNANSYSWAELKEAIENGTDAEIVLPGNIAAEGTIVVSRNVKISGATIYANANETMFKVENNGNLTLGEGLTLSGKKANCEQGCDDGDCNIVKGSEFTGTIDDHKGFFVQVENGGALNIEGAILRDFITDGSVKYAAPVVVNGGKFNMNSGEITHNSVGYTADNSKSGYPADKDKGEESTDYIGRDRAQHKYDSRGLLRKWEKTETAGAVILTAGADASLSGSSKLNGNRADTGAIVVQGDADREGATAVYTGKLSSLEISGSTQINNNVGIHHSGAVFIFNGGKVIFRNGEMSKNFSWNKGGAVWASEEAYGSSNFQNKRGEMTPAGEATFVMLGGEITDNVSVNRGGAIEVMSNHVALRAGKITGNACRVLGGAIYVEGDGPDRMYTLYISEGDITNNSAVNPTNKKNTKLYQALKPAEGGLCNFTNEFRQETDNSVACQKDYNQYWGHGGGIWLCPFGGNITVNLEDNNDVFIGGNSTDEMRNADWMINQGQIDPAGKDILVRPFNTGQGNGVNLENSGSYNKFQDETDTTGNTLEDGNFYAGPIGLTNQKSERVNRGLEISGNVAANGGGIASNGAIIFGKPTPKYVADLSFEVGKRWSENIPAEERKPVEIDLYLIDGEGKRIQRVKKLNNDGSISETGTITLDGQNLTHAVRIPLPYNVGDKPFNFATLTIEGDSEDKDMTNPAHLADIYKALEENKKISVKEWFIEVEEKIDGKVTEYKLPADGATIDSIDRVVEGVEIEEAGISFSTRTLNINVGEVIGNDSEPEIEKYVNEAVHQDIELNQVFDYDVLAYVTMDADKVTIMDDLVSDLEFVSRAEDVTVIDLGEANNHQVNNKINGEATGNNGTVGTEATDENKVAHKTTINGNNLTVILDDEATVKALRGHWVKVGFQAQIKKEYQDKILKREMKLSDLKDANVSKNDPVISDEGHDGIDNTARYTIEVDNEGKYNDESNTVTVKPETVELKVKKTWTNTENNSWPAGTTVTFGIYRHEGNKEEKIDEITLDSSKTSASITLPKLEGVKYSAKEIKVTKNGEDSKVDAASGNFVIGAINYIAKIIKDLFAGDTDGEHETGNEIKVDVKINKTDLGGKELDKAEIVVYNDKNEEVASWTSEEGKTFDLKLVPGSYSFKETVAPAGYEKVDTSINFTVDADGNVTVTEIKGVLEQADDGMMVLKDTPIRKISKQTLGGDELAGADMSLTLPDGKVQTWTSSADEAYEFAAKPGDYTLKEVVAPKGYEKVETEINFNIDDHGVIKVKEVKENGEVVSVVSDDGTTVILRDAPYKEPEAEKYVNKDVTYDFDNFDQTFTYDILAYVPYDATKLTVTDELVNALEFAGNGNVKVEDMGEGYDKNDHKVNGTVAKGGTEITADTAEAANGKLTVVINDATAYRRHWIKVSFDAQIKASAYDEVKAYLEAKKAGNAADAENWAKKISSNGLVLTEKEHDGIPNKAKYVVETANNGNFEPETNTVTVEPKTVDLKIKKSWKNIIWPTDTKVTFGVYRHKDGQEEKIDEITLDSKETSKTITLPKLEGVKYSAKEIKVTKNGSASKVDAASGNLVIGAINYIATIINDLFAGDTDGEHETQNEVKVDVKINKTDLGGKELDKAEIVVYNDKNEEVASWTSEAGKTFDLKLEPGNYSFKETVAPAGYEKVDTSINFTVDADGKVTVEEIDGVLEQLNDGTIILKDAPEKPAIEKYVNKKTDALSDTERDGTVHYDLSAFNEVYTYDIQAYITADATIVEVNDELKEVLEFVGDAPTSVVIKDGEGQSKAVAPKLTKAGEAVDYTIDEDAWDEGKLILTIGSDAEDAPKLYPNGKWLQITFDAKIKDKYKSLEAIKAADGVFTEITVNEEIDDADVNATFSGAEVDAHEGIVNDSSYRMKSKYASLNVNVDNEWAYGVKSNTVTVVPPTKEVTFNKTDLGGEELEGAKIKVVAEDGTEVDEWTSTTEEHVLNLADGRYTMTEVVAPKGYQQVTTEMVFVVADDKVTLETTEVNGGGKVSVENSEHIILEDAPEKPAIEKYVNKKYEDLTEEDRDGTVHTDLSAFNEVYTYDIQAYITADATVVEVTDELKSVLEFVGDAPTAVVVKDGEGASGAVAPKLTKVGEAVEDYSIDAEAWANGKLVLTMGSDAEDAPKLYPNGKWLQITFDAKIKDAYKSLEAIKGADGVWAEITLNEEIDDEDVAEAFSGAEVDAHEGIVNDSSYRIKSKVAALNVNVDNEWAYGVKSNTVTVVPPTTEVSFSKTDLEGKELPGAEMVLTDAEGNVIDKWTSTTEEHILNLADGEYIMTEKAAPEGYYCVTTEMHFEVKDGEATLKTAVVDNDGEIEVLAGTHIILKDAPKVQNEYEKKKDEGDEGEEEVVEKKVPEKSQVKEAYSARVKTGDDSTLYIWAVMLMISLAAIAVTIIRRRRTN